MEIKMSKAAHDALMFGFECTAIFALTLAILALGVTA